MKPLLAGQIKNPENHAAIFGEVNDVIIATGLTCHHFPRHTDCNKIS